MHYEVEGKYPVADAAKVTRRLAELGAAFGEAVLQVDCYFAHPARDFATTDEALRMRTVGSRNFVTYKGPKLDAATKTRRELELEIAPDEKGTADFAELLTALGFRAVAEVRKQRRKARFVWQAWEVEACWDAVESLGTFLELELTTDDARLDDARARLAALAAHLELGPGERRSYLELLLNRGAVVGRRG